jgi:hypothetical protein
LVDSFKARTRNIRRHAAKAGGDQCLPHLDARPGLLTRSVLLIEARRLIYSAQHVYEVGDGNDLDDTVIVSPALYASDVNV